MEGKDEDEYNDHDAGGVRCTLVKDGRAGGPDHEGDGHADTGPDERCPATEPVDQECRGNSGAEVEDLKNAIDEGLGVWVGNPNGVEYESEVV